MLAERYDHGFLLRHLLPLQSWKPFPPVSDREAWESLLEHPLQRERRSYLVGQAEALMEGNPWPALPATLYMEFVRNGNRSHYEGPYFERRHNLGVLVLAECFEHQGRFLDEIINGIWAITEEATWCVPAHAGNGSDPLPSQQVESVDLFNCETAMILSEAYFILKDELLAVSPALCDRLRMQVERRVIAQVEARDDLHWFSGFNNWTPWCASNVLGAAMYLLEDQERLAALTHKLMGVVDRFIGHYGPDGGCDEGPSYWGVAAGALLVFLELLHSRTDGAVDIYKEPLIVKMGRFIVDTHLCGPWFTNFADAPARLELRRPVVYRYGVRTGVELMKDAALLSMRGWQPEGQVYPPLGVGETLNHMLREIFWIPPEAKPKGIPNERVNWFPNIQVLVSRESEVLCRGLVLAAKGGHNAESHNHNDLGQFIIMLDGQPVIVDVGVETYTRKTFSPQRYEIWCIRSSGHNVPLVNGYEQEAGQEHRATNVTYKASAAGEELRMNLESAYPDAAGIESLRREFRFERREPATITVRDSIALRQPGIEVQIPLFSAVPVEVLGPGRLAFAAGGRRLLAEFAEDMEVTTEEVPIEDERLQASWGLRLWRTMLTYRRPGKSGEYILRFRPESSAS